MNDFLTHTQKKKKRKRKTTRKREWNEKRGKILGETNLFEESFIIFTRERPNDRTSSDNKSFSLSLSRFYLKKKTRALFCSRVSVGSIEIFFGLLPIENFSSFFIQKSS
jgi:hypothetical protein